MEKIYRNKLNECGDRIEYATVGYMAKRIQMRKQRFMAIQKIAQEKKLQVDGGQQPSAMMTAGPDHSHSHSSHGHSHSHQHGPKQSVQQSIQGKNWHLRSTVENMPFHNSSVFLSSFLPLFLSFNLFRCRQSTIRFLQYATKCWLTWLFTSWPIVSRSSI